MDSVLYETADAVAIVRLNRPDRLNAVTAEMGQRFVELMLRADSDRDVRAVVLTGSGRGFCSGADLSGLEDPGATDAAAAGEWIRPQVVLEIRKPVIAAVNGPAVGLGFALALSADVRFVAADAKLTTGFARLGLAAEYGTAWMLPRLVGHERAMDLLLSARTISGDEAVALGLALRSLPADEVLPAALEYAMGLARHSSPRSMAAIRRQVIDGWGQDVRAAFETSIAAMVESFSWPDLTEGFSAQAERRPPEFPPLEQDGRGAGEA